MQLTTVSQCCIPNIVGVTVFGIPVNSFGTFYSVTALLSEQDLPGFLSVFASYRCAFQRQTLLCSDAIAHHLISVKLIV